MKNSGDSVFEGIPVGPEEGAIAASFLADHDFAADTRRAFTNNLKKFARWFSTANREPFTASRVTTRDVSDFRDHLRRERQQAVATVNRALMTLRKFFGWLVDKGHVASNPAKGVKELKRQALAPKGLDRSQVRKLLREVELRTDIRADAIFHLLLFTDCRVGDLVALELHDLIFGERSGSVVFRLGKGGKQRTVPLALPARRAIHESLNTTARYTKRTDQRLGEAADRLNY